MKGVAVIGTYYRDRDRAIKASQERTKRYKRPYVIMSFSNGHLIIAKSIFNQIAKQCRNYFKD